MVNESELTQKPGANAGAFGAVAAASNRSGLKSLAESFSLAAGLSGRTSTVAIRLFAGTFSVVVPVTGDCLLLRWRPIATAPRAMAPAKQIRTSFLIMISYCVRSRRVSKRQRMDSRAIRPPQGVGF